MVWGCQWPSGASWPRRCRRCDQVGVVNTRVTGLQEEFNAFSLGTDPAALLRFIQGVQAFQAMHPDVFVELGRMRKIQQNVRDLLLSMTDQDVSIVV